MTGPLDNFLERFRRAGGVPAAVGAGVEAELGVLFAELDSIEREAAELRARVEAERATRRAHLERELAEIAEQGETRAERAREDAYRAVREVAEAQVAQIASAGERAVADVRACGEERMPALLAEVVARVAGTAS